MRRGPAECEDSLPLLCILPLRIIGDLKFKPPASSKTQAASFGGTGATSAGGTGTPFTLPDGTGNTSTARGAAHVAGFGEQHVTFGSGAASFTVPQVFGHRWGQHVTETFIGQTGLIIGARNALHGARRLQIAGRAVIFG